MNEPVWLDRRVVLAIHERLLAEHGGVSGVRDEGLPDSALARAGQIFTYEQADLSQLAAAYAAGIVRNHPFVDGNKRIAFMAAYVFLARNGSRLVASEPDATRMILDLAAGSIDELDCAAWLRGNTR